MAPALDTSAGDNPIVQGIEAISTRRLPDRLQSVFHQFSRFNAIQSKCLHYVYEQNGNFVLSAPTGSGKTAIFELAICRLLRHDTQGPDCPKIVYQAPTKALCGERYRDWRKKFSFLGLHCDELTGDSDYTQLGHIEKARIIITTPEKWDSVTRRWKDRKKTMQLVKLFLIDEVHILKEDRGSSLEAVVSRMKSVGSDLRFIALSATVPNSDDVADWLGRNASRQDLPTIRESFDDSLRPVRLEKHVYGFQANGANDFQFEQALNQKYVRKTTCLCL